MEKLIIRMVSGKEHVIVDDAEMMQYYISYITDGFKKKINAGNSTLIIDKIEEYRIELDYDSMS